MRRHFEERRGETDEAEIRKLVAEGADAAQFIRDFVVQAKMNERGNFEMKPEAHHAGMEAEDTVLPPRRGGGGQGEGDPGAGKAAG